MAAIITIQRNVLTSTSLLTTHVQHTRALNFRTTFVAVSLGATSWDRRTFRRLWIDGDQRRRLRVPNTDLPSAPPSDVPRDFMKDVTTGLFSTSLMPPDSGAAVDCPRGRGADFGIGVEVAGVS